MSDKKNFQLQVLFYQKCMLLCLLLSLLLSGQAVAEKTAIEVTDARGKVITLAQPAERIVALAPHIVENVFSAGAGHRLVAAVSYADYPEVARELPRVGSYNRVSYESVLALAPDLVLAWRSGNGDEAIERLEALGLTVYVDELNTLDDIAAEVRTLGLLAGTQDKADSMADQWQAHLTHLQQRYQNATPVSVFYQVWNDPLQTLNDEHLVGDVIRLCGGQNVFADALALAPKINSESVLARNPDAIVASGMGEERPEWLDEWKQYPALNAVKNDNLFFVPPDIIQRHTLRILEGAELMCRHLEAARGRS